MTQPEAMNRAIKLALRLECAGQSEAAAELRRLHAGNQELLAACQLVIQRFIEFRFEYAGQIFDETSESDCITACRRAISKVTGAEA